MIKVTDYAGGVNIGDGVHPATSAFVSAFSAASGTRDLVFIPPGNYLIDQTLYIPDYLHMQGVSKLSQLIRAPGLNGNVLFMHDTQQAHLENFYLSGGIGREPPGTPESQKINNDSYGYFGSEACFGGTDNRVSDVVLIEWNSLGILAYGERLTIERSWGRKIPPASYKPDSGPNASLDLGGTYAWLTPATSFCHGLRMIDCGATGVRGPGIFVGGTDGSLVRFYAADCHREYCPCNPQGFTSGGGQIALSHTMAPGGAPESQQPQRWVIDSPFALNSPGPAVTGIEIHDGWGIEIRSPNVMGTRTGISISGSRMVRVTGGIVGATSVQGMNIYDSRYINVSTGFEYCNRSINISGTCDSIDLRGSSYYANAYGVLAGPGVTNLQQ